MEYGNNNMDDKIRAALEGTEMPFDATHWQQFEQALDAANLTAEDSPAEQIFDANAAATLSDIDGGASDWNAFEKLLDTAEAQDPFDAVIAAGLTAATANTGADWGSFEEMLSAAEAADVATDNALDQKAQQTFDNYEAPYQPENWDLMRERIQEEFSLRRKLLRYKVAEITLMLLAIFTLFNYLPKNELGNFIIIEKVKERIQKKVTPQNEEAAALKSQPIAQGGTEQKKAKSTAGASVDLDIFSTEIPTNYIATGNPVSIYSSKKVKSFSPLAILEPSLEMESKVNLEPNGQIITEEKEEKRGLFAWMRKSEESEEEKKEEVIKSFLLEAIESKKAEELTIEKEEVLKASKVKLEHKNVRLAMFTSADLFGVYAPYDRFFDFAPGTTYGANMGGGILFDFQKDRFHLVTGGAYMPKFYKPYLGGEVLGSFETGYVKENLRTIELNIVHIPLDVRYDFVQNGKWRLYGSGGVAFNFVLETVYDIEKKVLARSSNISEADVINTRNFNSNLDKKEFTPGVTEGGRLPDNTFLTVQLGFGVERFVTDRWSFFFEPMYQQQFSGMGIGPNENSFKTISLRLGAKATMFGK